MLESDNEETIDFCFFILLSFFFFIIYYTKQLFYKDLYQGTSFIEYQRYKDSS